MAESHGKALLEHPAPDNSWRLFSIYVSKLDDLDESVALPEPYFSCLLVLDAREEPDAGTDGGRLGR